jgi:hypothetical protein
MIDIATLDFAKSFEDSAMNIALADSFDFTDLAFDDIIQGFHSSFNFEKEVDEIIQLSGSSKMLHARLTEKETTNTAFLPQDSGELLEEEDIFICAPQRSLLPTNKEENEVIFDLSAKDVNCVSQSLEAAMNNLDECMRRTAQSRTLISKHVSGVFSQQTQVLLQSSKLKSISKMTTKRNNLIKVKPSKSKPAIRRMLEKKYSHGTSKNPLLTKLRRGTSLTGVKKDYFSRGTMDLSPVVVSSQKRLSIAGFLRQSKENRVHEHNTITY